MLKPHRLFSTLPLLLLAASVCLATDFGDITVLVGPVPSRNRGHGYVEYKITVTNRASQTAHNVRLTIPATGSGASLDDVSRSVVVQPSSTVVVSLFVPTLSVFGNGLGVTIDGRREIEVVAVNLVEPGEMRPSVMISQNANRKGFNAPAPPSSSPSSPPPGSSIAVTPIQFAPPTTIQIADWSESWLGYSSFDCVVVTADEVRALPANVSAALWQYVKCGGTLLVLGSVDVPEAWKVRSDERMQIPTYYVGFGQCLVSPRDTGTFSADDWKYLHQSSSRSLYPFIGPEIHGQADANGIFPVVDRLDIPVRGLFLLMLFFVIIIGPVNLFVLSRRKKKIWLLWTVPAISLITCVAVSAYSIMSEGWSGKARTAGVTILDETSHQATTIGWTAFYSPITQAEGLRYGYETELTPQIEFQYAYGRAVGSSRAIDWTQDQHLSSGWLAARVPAHFKIRKSEIRRERVTVNRGADGSLTIVNGLGADVRQIWFADRDGRIYRSDNVRAGASAGLSLQPNFRAEGKVDELRSGFDGLKWFAVNDWMDKPHSRLMPGCYIAALASSPFIEDGLRGVGSRTSESVVYGILKMDQ